MHRYKLLNCKKKNPSSTFLAVTFSETRPKLDLKAIRFVVNEKVL
jgi:hypothetical protein